MNPRTIEYERALGVFLEHMRCVERDGRERQLTLYSEDIHYEFRFAKDRPKPIGGIRGIRMDQRRIRSVKEYFE